MVRQALADPIPPVRKRPVLGPAVELIDWILEGDRQAPRKQRVPAAAVLEK
jgi:hypothetical protein